MPPRLQDRSMPAMSERCPMVDMSPPRCRSAAMSGLLITRASIIGLRVLPDLPLMRLPGTLWTTVGRYFFGDDGLPAVLIS
jgi:hypothetical protein